MFIGLFITYLNLFKFYKINKQTMEFADLILTPKLDGVFLHDHLHVTVEGTLCITAHHLLLSSRQNGKQGQELWVI